MVRLKKRTIYKLCHSYYAAGLTEAATGEDDGAEDAGAEDAGATAEPLALAALEAALISFSIFW